MELFHREGRRLSPVPEARYLLSEAEEILDRVSATRSNLAGMRDRVRGTLRIVTMPGPSAFLMPQFVSRFIGDARDIRVTLSTRSSPQILNLIAAQSFDIGFCDMGTRSETEDRWQSELFSELVTTCTCLCGFVRLFWVGAILRVLNCYAISSPVYAVQMAKASVRAWWYDLAERRWRLGRKIAAVWSWTDKNRWA